MYERSQWSSASKFSHEDNISWEEKWPIACNVALYNYISFRTDLYEQIGEEQLLVA